MRSISEPIEIRQTRIARHAAWSAIFGIAALGLSGFLFLSLFVDGHWPGHLLSIRQHMVRVFFGLSGTAAFASIVALALSV
jgi:hypothetical protein